MSISLLISSFLVGLVMFLAPCTFPLVPSYLAFISGSNSGAEVTRRKVFRNGLFFILGFSFIYVLFGTALGYFGQNISPSTRRLLMRIGGGIIILFGLYMLGIFKFPAFSKYKKFDFSKRIKPGKPMSSFILGFSYGTGWSPCQGPVLGSIATLAATSSTVLQGTILMIAFSAGLAIPFLLIALAYGSGVKNLKFLNKHLGIISKVGAILLIIIGFFLLTNQYGKLNGFFFENFEFIDTTELQESLV